MSDSGKAVFLSYASQDAAAAKRICDALRAAGVEVWFDQSELRGGDAWDAKIRKQIKDCALFVPVISATTQQRHEGYFRLEWRLADQRTHLMGKAKAFLVPVCIDDTRDAEADVPDSFMTVQWTRLPGGDGATMFAERVKSLLVGAALEPGGSRPGERGGGAASPKKAGRWWLGLAVTAGVVALAFWRPWDRAKNPEAASARPQESSHAMPLSPARQITAKARLLFDNPNYTRDDLDLAESYCKQALKLDDSDAEVWAAYAELSSQFLGGREDTSLERRELARFQAERAMKLAPTSVAARFAKSSYLRRVGDRAAMAEAEQLLRKLAEEKPDDARVLNSLGKVIGEFGRRLDRADEALAVLARAAAIPSGRAEALSETGWILFNLERFAEAETAIDASLADQASRSALFVKVELTLERGALADAQAALAKMPLETVRSDAGVALAARVWLFSRQPEKALEVLNGVTRDYLTSNTGGVRPVDLFRGEAYRLQGKTQAAQTAWKAALRVVDKLLEEQPRHVGALANRAHLLALLGERGAAATAMRLYEEIGSEARGTANKVAVIAIWALIEPPERVLTRLEAVFKGRRSGSLRVDPRFDMLRGEPRFEALLAEAPKPAVTTAAPAPDAKSVAVLPFVNLSSDREQEYFSDGLTEEILNALARERDLRVPGRTSSFSFKGKNVSAAEIARALNVSRLVEGSVQRAGTRVRIRVTLSRVADNSSEELGTFTEELADIFTLQDKIARAVVEKLTQRAATKAVAVLTKNPEAYEAYLRGRALQTRSGSNAAEAATLYEKAVTLDPVFALAWTRLAEARFQPYGAGVDRNPALVKQMHEAVARALEAQPDLPEALVMRGNLARFIDGDFAAARRDLNRAAALQPPTAQMRDVQALLARDTGNWPEAFRFSREALELDPQNGANFSSHAISIFAVGGDYLEADRLYVRALSIQGAGVAGPFINRINLRFAWRGPEAALRLMERAPPSQAGRDFLRAKLLLALGRVDEARASSDAAAQDVTAEDTRTTVTLVTKSQQLAVFVALGQTELARRRAEELRAETVREFERGNRAPFVYGAFIRAELVLGHRDAARVALEDWRRENQRMANDFKQITEFTRWAAACYAMAGDGDRAIALLRESGAKGVPINTNLRHDPEFAALRPDPRFQELVRQQETWTRAQPDPIDP